MPTINHQYYMTIDDFGLKFKKANNDKDATQKIDNYEYRLIELNELGYRFIAAVPIRHQVTDISVVVAIFEQKLEK